MSVVTIGLDFAKTVVEVHGVDEAGVTVLRPKLARADMIAFFTKQPPCVVGMEACSSAHHRARLPVEISHTVRLIPPQYVKRNKTDAADAEAICEAVAKSNMRFVAIKAKQQQAILALHRAAACWSGNARRQSTLCADCSGNTASSQARASVGLQGVVSATLL